MADATKSYAAGGRIGNGCRFQGRALVRIALAVIVASSLAACSGTRDALGIGKRPPDEFAIVTKAPLVVPPDFSLRPPEPGAERPQELSPGERARQTVFGAPEAPIAPVGGQSAGEFALLKDAKADTTDDTIRDVIDAETTGSVNKDRSFAERILFWRGDGGTSEPPIADQPDAGTGG